MREMFDFCVGMIFFVREWFFCAGKVFEREWSSFAFASLKSFIISTIIGNVMLERQAQIGSQCKWHVHDCVYSHTRTPPPVVTSHNSPKHLQGQRGANINVKLDFGRDIKNQRWFIVLLNFEQTEAFMLVSSPVSCSPSKGSCATETTSLKLETFASFDWKRSRNKKIENVQLR